MSDFSDRLIKDGATNDTLWRAGTEMKRLEDQISEQFREIRNLRSALSELPIWRWAAEPFSGNVTAKDIEDRVRAFVAKLKADEKEANEKRLNAANAKA